MSRGRFQKGQSGNPSGRPKKRRPHVSAFDVIFDKTLSVTQGGVERELTVDEALQLQTYQAALKGSKMAIRQVLKMIEKRETALLKLSPPATAPVTMEVEHEAENADEAMRILDDVGMAAYAHHTASGLAYGHQRRVEIARAIAVKPKYILLDEPVAGMNDVEAAELGRLFRSFAERGIGILLIEHNMRFVNALCGHIYVLNTGRIIAEGTPAEITRNETVVSAYLGA